MRKSESFARTSAGIVTGVLDMALPDVPVCPDDPDVPLTEPDPVVPLIEPDDPLLP